MIIVIIVITNGALKLLVEQQDLNLGLISVACSVTLACCSNEFNTSVLKSLFHKVIVTARSRALKANRFNSEFFLFSHVKLTKTTPM